MDVDSAHRRAESDRLSPGSGRSGHSRSGNESFRMRTWLARHWMVALGTMLVPVEAVRKGADTYFDFLNIKWVMGWLLANGDFNLKGIATTRKWGPPYLDIWQAVWSTTGVWWLPAVIHGLVHALLVPSVFVLAKTVAPELPNLCHQVVSVAAAAAPLVLMQIGTTTGHVYSALPLVWSLTLVLSAGPEYRTLRERSFEKPTTLEEPATEHAEDGSWRRLCLAGAVFAMAPLLKPSVLALAPAHIIGVMLIVGSVSGLMAFGIGFLGAYSVGAIGWAVIVAMVTEASPFAAQAPGLPVSGAPLVAFAVVSVSVALVWWSIPRSRIRLAPRPDTSPLVVVAMSLVALPISWQFADYLRQTAPDLRWFVTDYGQLFGRLLHAGDLQYGFQTKDLESAYFDTSIPVAMVLLGGAVLALPALTTRRSFAIVGPRVGVVWFVCFPLLYNIWATGYTRYASQVVPLVGVAGFAILVLVRGRVARGVGAVVVLLVLLLPHFHPDRVSADLPRFGQIAYDEPVYDDFVSREEVEMLNDLIPENSTVLAIGTLNTFLIPQLGRSDLDWWFWKPKRHEVAVMSGDIIVMFSPGDSDRLPEYAEQGLLYDDCSVLRFRRSSVGLCIGGVDPEVRDSG